LGRRATFHRKRVAVGRPRTPAARDATLAGDAMTTLDWLIAAATLIFAVSGYFR
jgi:hypothetical protein